MTTTLLAIGDLHLGRLPGGLPDDLADHDLAPRDLGPVAALERVVDEALARGVDAVLLAGDVVDQDNAFFEALGPLERAVTRLVEAGIAVLAVSGNHDATVLPRLVRAVDGFRLLGADGGWETVPVGAPDAGGLLVVGRSFPDRTAGPVPVDEIARMLPPGERPVVGLLHADLDAGPKSPYAPVLRTDLARAPVDLWLLGPIHQPSAGLPDGPPGSLGSVTPLDAGERGARGAWIVERDEAGVLALSRLAVAPLRFEQVEVDVAALVDGAEDAVLAAVQACASGLEPAARESLRALGCRVVVRGATGDPARARRVLDELQPERLRLARDGLLLFVESFACEIVPAIDLERLAAGHDPLGVLARCLQGLERGDVPEALATDARRLLEDVARRARAAGLPPCTFDDGEVVARLRAAGFSLLEKLLASREDSP